MVHHKEVQYVVLVDHSGKRRGIAEKMEAHEKGLLHRAFSIIILNKSGEMLLQKRAIDKYHFAGLWSNACCSHPRPGEKILNAAKRRLKEELGIATDLSIIDHLEYSFLDKKNKMTEHEFDHILMGNFTGEINYNLEEVAAVRWVKLRQLESELKNYPHKFTPWFRLIIKKVNLEQ